VSAAEQTVGLLVALARNIPQAHAALKQGRWERSRWGGVELDGKTLGVVGFGRIGQQVARRAVGLGVRVVAYDPFVSDDRFRELGVDHAPTVDEVLSAADFLTCTASHRRDPRPLNRYVAKMRDGARIVNAARGALVDEEALAEAIRSGKLAGAALDVFSKEPYDGPLLELDQVVVTPHLAASTDEAQDRAGVIIAEQVVAALEGGLVSNAVNIPVVDKAALEVLGPFIPLAAKLGRLAVELVGGRPRKIVVAAHGPLSDYDTRLLTVAALNGVFEGRVDQTVNYVNAPAIAAERGITVSEERFRASRDYMNVVEVRVTPDAGDEVEVSGTTIGPEPRLFLASAFGFGIDIELAPDMVFFRYDDIPGVIGRVGTMFGENGFNIANMAVSARRRAARLITLRSTRSPARSSGVRAGGFDDARFIRLSQCPRARDLAGLWRVAAFSGRQASKRARGLDDTATAGMRLARRAPAGQIVKSIVVVCDGEVSPVRATAAPT
jgi:D-3-phosphoglycerate dehydrogenase